MTKATGLILGLLLGAVPVAAQSVRQFDAFAVAVGPELPDQGTRFVVTWQNGQVIEFTVPDVFGPATLANELWQYNSQRLVVESEKQIIIVDPLTGSVVDRFVTLRRTKSPTGRFVAVQRHTANGAQVFDDVISVYDLQNTPQQNRPADTAMTGPGKQLAAGRIVYPPPNVAAQRYAMAETEDEAYHLLSDLVWLDGSLLTFVSQHQGGFQVVLVSPTSGSSETPLGLNGLLRPGVLPTTAALYLKVRGVERIGDTATTVTLRITFDASHVLQSTLLIAEVIKP